MPIQAPQWTDYLNCPVCCREFGLPPRSPISLSCGHTLCRQCLKHLHRKQCPFDQQTVIQADPEDLVVNTAILQLAGFEPPAQPYHPPCIQSLPEADRQAYDVIVKCLEHLAAFLKYCGNSNNAAGSRLSRPMQRKLVTLLQCAMTDGEGRGRAARAARSLGERSVTELILQHQNPQQLSANLWAAVRARGCQFLGPAMQEEVLKLVLLTLEDGSALSRKVLVMFVVQRLEPHFPQASKTSIGHVVQLLYRASCFKVSKRESASSLMQLKEECRTYESLRREHDAQIVQIATEAGLRIAPDQWSSLLYGDTAHKSHMQSIIDKLQSPSSFAQSVQELFIALQRTGDPAQLLVMSMHLDRLANVDASPDAKSPTWQQLAEIMTSLKEVVSGLIQYLQQQTTGRDANHNQKPALESRPQPQTSQPSPVTGSTTPTHAKYKVLMCRDAATRSFCPRGNACTFAHTEEELERYRSQPNGSYEHGPPMDIVPMQMPHPNMMQQAPVPVPMYMLPPPQHMEGYPPGPMPPNAMAPNEFPPDTQHPAMYDNLLHGPPSMLMNQQYVHQAIRVHTGLLMPVPKRPCYSRYDGQLVVHEDPNVVYQRMGYNGHLYQGPLPNQQVPLSQEASHQGMEMVPSMPGYGRSNTPPFREPTHYPTPVPSGTAQYMQANNNHFFNNTNLQPEASQELPREMLGEPTWTADNRLFDFNGQPTASSTTSNNRLGENRAKFPNVRSDYDNMLEEELQALERRFDIELKNSAL